MQKIQIILLVLIITGLGLIFTQKYWAMPLAYFIVGEKSTSAGTEQVRGIQGEAFNKIGHLVKDNPGLKPGVWFLVYEAPGAPALTQELSFDIESVCSANGRTGKCPDILLPLSSLIRVEGDLYNGVVRVFRAGNQFNK
jgi:hypothetical protein